MLYNYLQTAVYPFLSAGLEWTRPYDLMLNSASDVAQIHVEPEYIPNGESDAATINIGRDKQSGEKLG